MHCWLVVIALCSLSNFMVVLRTYRQVGVSLSFYFLGNVLFCCFAAGRGKEEVDKEKFLSKPKTLTARWCCQKLNTLLKVMKSKICKSECGAPSSVQKKIKWARKLKIDSNRIKSKYQIESNLLIEVSHRIDILNQIEI